MKFIKISKVIDPSLMYLSFDGRTVKSKRVTAQLIDGHNGIYRLCKYGAQKYYVSGFAHSQHCNNVYIFIHTTVGRYLVLVRYCNTSAVR